MVTVTLPAGNFLDLPPGEYSMVNGGYFVIHTPPPPGKHVITISIEYDDGFAADVTYELSVEADR